MDNPGETVITAPKNTVFQVRINQEIKTAAEELFSKCGITLTDAINMFIQQSLNVGGLPFNVKAPETTVSKDKTLEMLLEKLQEMNNSSDDSA